MKLEIRRLRSLSLACNELKSLEQVTFLSVTPMRAYVISKVPLITWKAGATPEKQRKNGRRKLPKSRDSGPGFFASLDTSSLDLFSEGLGVGRCGVIQPLSGHRGGNDVPAEECPLRGLIARVRGCERKNQELNWVSSNCCLQSGHRFFPWSF